MLVGRAFLFPMGNCFSVFFFLMVSGAVSSFCDSICWLPLQQGTRFHVLTILRTLVLFPLFDGSAFSLP